jgi:hypothetical protein
MLQYVVVIVIIILVVIVKTQAFSFWKTYYLSNNGQWIIEVVVIIQWNPLNFVAVYSTTATNTRTVSSWVYA